ncbi:unnamed protein product [Didymodactylos carnosus]|uniref:Uncharacterized protein n=1 Tax=Didymodactylos carnosus TaxID=1234261 RepID=A0A8S2S0C1_9BILA|nr:unnamed protein product [Didymodactylos carnosus]CAF4197137.1 unnamed protein product [Didymodactylos carnosus]
MLYLLAVLLVFCSDTSGAAITDIVKEKLQKQQQQSFKKSDNLIIEASLSSTTNIIKLENIEPLSNTSYLRKELRDACQSWPVYWADSMLESDLPSMIKEEKLIQDGEFILEPIHPKSKGATCNSDPVGGEIPLDPNEFICQFNCQYAKCKV